MRKPKVQLGRQSWEAVEGMLMLGGVYVCTALFLQDCYREIEREAFVPNE